MHTLQGWQKRIFILCWVAYAGEYLCRTNLSIALPGMVKEFNWSKASIGMIGSSFFWAYAIGQLINGRIGDRLNSKAFIFTGLVTASFINLFVGFSSNLKVIVILWAINGFFLATLWGPMIKIISQWFPDNKKIRISVYISLSGIAGYLFAWGLFGQIIARTSWRWAFWLPAMVVIPFSLLWLARIRNKPEEVGFPPVIEHKTEVVGNIEQTESPSILRIIFHNRLWLIAIACMAQGAVKEGISLWTPTLLSDAFRLDAKFVSALSLFIPLVSILGIFCSGWLGKLFKSNEKKAVFVLFLGTAICFIFLLFLFGVNNYLTVLLLSISAALVSGANAILLTIIPLGFAKQKLVSSMAGFLDFCVYVGAAASGYLIGALTDHFGWKYVIAAWAVIALIGLLSTNQSLKADKRQKSKGTFSVEG